MNKHELEERTLKFSIELIKTLKTLPKNIYNYKIIGQLIDSGTSIGANYREANGAESRKDFKHKINISFKEARETNYWLSILQSTNQENMKINTILIESDELMRIFGKIVSSCSKQNVKSQI